MLESNPIPCLAAMYKLQPYALENIAKKFLPKRPLKPPKNAMCRAALNDAIHPLRNHIAQQPKRNKAPRDAEEPV